MTDFNRDGRIDAADIATEYAVYNSKKPRRSTPQRGSSTGSTGGAAWAIIAAAALALLTLCSR